MLSKLTSPTNLRLHCSPGCERLPTEKLLGLNRTALREHRSKRIRHLVALAKYADSDREAASLLEEAKQSSAEYAAFARALFG
jgi:hypothetical protein